MPTIPSDDHNAACPDTGNYGFARPVWFEMLARHCFASENCLWPRIEQGGHSVTLPLIKNGETLDSLSNYYSFSYAPIVTGHPYQTQKQAMLTALAEQLRAHHSRVSLYPLFDDDGTAQTIRAAFAQAGWIALLTDQNSNYYLDIDGRDFETYWAQRPGQLRSSVRRKGRDHPYDFEITHHMSDAIWQDYTAVYQASWKNTEPYPDMIRAIAEEAESRGVLRMGFARARGVPIAVQLWTIEGPTACLHKLAHDSAHDHHSPGTLLSHYMFEHMINREKVARIDYGTGNNAYKKDWMDHVRPMLKLDCFNPYKARMWLPALKTRISQLVGRRG